MHINRKGNCSVFETSRSVINSSQQNFKTNGSIPILPQKDKFGNFGDLRVKFIETQ